MRIRWTYFSNTVVTDPGRIHAAREDEHLRNTTDYTYTSQLRRSQPQRANRFHARSKIFHSNHQGLTLRPRMYLAKW